MNDEVPRFLHGFCPQQLLEEIEVSCCRVTAMTWRVTEGEKQDSGFTGPLYFTPDPGTF